jgi:hypothetical protein
MIKVGLAPALEAHQGQTRARAATSGSLRRSNCGATTRLPAMLPLLRFGTSVHARLELTWNQLVGVGCERG